MVYGSGGDGVVDDDIDGGVGGGNCS